MLRILIIIWQWLEGNKTVLGLVLITIAGEMDSGYLETNYFKWFIEFIGGLLMGVGVGHKLLRGRANTGKSEY
jgi:hypothetical protein